MQGDKGFKIMKQRILYFDWIKGLAIILVVMGHLYTFSETTSGNLINKLIGSFHMPLFILALTTICRCSLTRGVLLCHST